MPPMTLEELAGEWLTPAREEVFALPGVTNFRGAAQAAWDISGIQNWTCAPTGMGTPTALLYVRDGHRIRRFPREGLSYRWKAYEIERRGHGVHTTLRMAADKPAVIERMQFDRDMTIYLVFTGLPRVWRFTDYWNLPPEDVPQFNVRRSERGFLIDDCKTFGFAEFVAPGALHVYRDWNDWLDGAAPCEGRGKVGVAEIQVKAGQEIFWTGLLACDAPFPIDPSIEWERGPAEWRRVWNAAFTPENAEFSGHLPTRNDALSRLYYMSVLSLLMTRRFAPKPTPRAETATGGQCIWVEQKRPLEQAYVAFGLEGAITTMFLWEVEFEAPVLARLDPVVLRGQLEALMRVDLHRHWGVEIVSGAGAGMAYGVNPGAFLSAVADYVRITGDRAWAMRHLDYLRTCARPGLTDYGDYQNILECVSTYEHAIASFNALNVAGMRFLHELTGEQQYADQADALAREVLTLYADGPFACRQPDGSRRVVKTVLDFIYVGRCMTRDLPEAMKRGMRAFFERDLKTDHWLYALAPTDPNALTPDLPGFQTFRADHQATGSYDGWPARAASALLRMGERHETIAWLQRVQDVTTREGPFGQAHFIHPDGIARKASFYNGNCYFGAAGGAFAATLLDELSE